MSSKEYLGSVAIVVGAGVGGLFAAGALKDYFREVIIVERDVLPSGPDFRMGVPQGPHGHAVLKRGENIAEAFFPGFRQALKAAGGVGLDLDKDAGRFEGGKWSESANSGLTISSQSRALLEHVLRQEVLKVPNISIRDNCLVSDYAMTDNIIKGVKLDRGAEKPEALHGDMVIDCSGRSGKLPEWLESNGYGLPPTEKLGIGLVYVTGIFEATTHLDGNPLLCTTRESLPALRGGTAMPIEGTQWMVTLNGRQRDIPPLDLEGFMGFAKSLPIPMIYDRMKNSKLVGRLRRFVIAESYWRHYEQMESFPERLIPLGDTVAGFNPVFGQGMSAAAVDAEQLKNCLDQRMKDGAGLDGLHANYFPLLADVVGAAWNGTATYDLMHEGTKGVRPDDFPQRRAAFIAMGKLAEEDADIRLKRMMIGNMLESPSILFTDDFIVQLQAKMAELEV